MQEDDVANHGVGLPWIIQRASDRIIDRVPLEWMNSHRLTTTKRVSLAQWQRIEAFS